MRRWSWVLAVMVLGACSNSPSDVSGGDELEGIWSWVSTSGGLQGQTFTPASTGKRFALQFTSGGEVVVERNDSIVQRTAFDVVPASGNDTRKRVEYGAPLQLLSSADEHLITLRGDTLELDEGCCDRYAHVFVRGN
jgi:hypothetical protein